MKTILKKIVPNKILKGYRKFKKYIRTHDFKGNYVTCPVCQSKLKTFEPFGVVKRENARCSNCGSLERHRLLWKYFNEELAYIKNSPKGRILHFAPENMFYNFFDGLKNIEYVPCDLNPSDFQFKGKSNIHKVDITNIPFDTNYFDFIVCNHVLEHIHEDTLAMSEMYRVMKKGGLGIFQVPIDYNRAVTYEDFSITSPEAREKAFGQRDHVRLYGLDYKNRLESVGFKVTVDDYVKRFTPKKLKKYGLMSSELIYNCSKL